MARDLQLRLLLTCGGVTLAALLLLGSVFTAVLGASVADTHERDMRAETSNLATQLNHAFARRARRAAIQRLLRRDSELLGKQILLLDRAGRPRYDSSRWTPFSRGSWSMTDFTALRHGRWARLQGENRFGLQSPVFAHGREVGAVALVVTSADAQIPWLQLLPQLTGALAFLILIWLAVAAFLSRSLTRPLRRVSAGITLVTDGEYGRPIPEQGWSEARDLARRYNEMAAEVARSRQHQRDFVANAAHELKTPVALVAGFARSLVDGTAERGDAVDDAVECIQIESEHLARIIDHLFALASLDADVEALVPAPCHPDVLLGQVVGRFMTRALAEGKRLELSPLPALPLCLWDVDRVTSALANVISNGLDHIPAGGMVRASIHQDEVGIVFQIKDSGCGIAPDDLPHIFDRFFRGRQRRGDGHAGLGLALVREVVERHAGVVSVESRLDEGTCFTLSLPASSDVIGATTPTRDRKLTA